MLREIEFGVCQYQVYELNSRRGYVNANLGRYCGDDVCLVNERMIAQSLKKSDTGNKFLDLISRHSPFNKPPLFRLGEAHSRMMQCRAQTGGPKGARRWPGDDIISL